MAPSAQPIADIASTQPPAATVDKMPLVAEEKAPTRVKYICDLPEEMLHEIFSNCSQYELICLSLVCHRFRELAATQLYRNFHIVFPDEDDPAFDSPIDGLAGGLDTFVTSDYNYAKHLRDLSLDTLSSGLKAEQAYKPYLNNVSCGKFMNTLLLLTLRKAKSLETFRWNIRVELSRPVYKALHQISSLKNVHIRMQDGPSIYETPPPLPYWTHNSPTDTGNSHVPAPPWLEYTSGLSSTSPFSSTVANLQQAFPNSQFLANINTYGPPPAAGSSAPAFKPSNKARSSKKDKAVREPPTIAGFKDLKSLSVLEIDSLDITDEIKACVDNSAQSLRKLRLSFSTSLALQARKPCREVEHSESDDDDDFEVTSVNNANDAASGPTMSLRAQEQRKLQDKVLGRIFGAERTSVRKQIPRKRNHPPCGNPQEAYLNSMKKVSERLVQGIHGTRESIAEKQETLAMIVDASRKYVEAVESRAKARKEGENLTPSDQGTAAQEAGPSSIMEAHGPVEGEPDGKGPQNILGSTPNQPGIDLKPEDIDIVAPEEQLAEEQQDDSSPADSPKNENDAGSATGTAIDKDQSPLAQLEREKMKQMLSEKLANLANKYTSAAGPCTSKSATDEAGTASKKTPGNASDHEPESVAGDPAAASSSTGFDANALDDNARHEINVLQAAIAEASETTGVDTPEEAGELDFARGVSKYSRTTRGLPLESLSLHLIPAKASVLSRAVDFRRLQKLTLLNVGNQAPIWKFIGEEDKIAPLPLRKIFTDHVTLPFLHTVSQLECVEELFMLERRASYKPESFAPKTKINLEQIRRFALRKHLGNLKRLIIRNDADKSWDIDLKTMRLICQSGRILEELAISVSITGIHMLLQHISGVVNLRALYVISLRSEDTCLSVVRETRKFIVDTVCQNPALQLEWLALGDEEHAQRIIRKTDVASKEDKDKSGKNKGKGKGKEAVGNANSPYFVFPVEDLDALSDSDEDEDSPPYLKYDLIEHVHFYDIWGVDIFKKEVVSGIC